MIQNCLDQILTDVVRVDLVPASDCQLPIPFSVAGLTEMTIPNLSDWHPQTAITALGVAQMSIAYDVQDGDDALMEGAPRLTQTPKTVQSGIVITHELQVPIVAGFATTEQAASLLHRRDFHVILTTEGDGLYMLYSLPNTCEVLMPENNIHQDSTMKVSVKSKNYAIKLL